MYENRGHIPSKEWEIIVDNVPIVSVDLVVKMDGGVVLGKRRNKPAKGEWFVPGGRVYKNERLEDAAHRVAMDELSVEIEIEEELGVYEHFYEKSDVDDVGKHYVTRGYTVSVLGQQELIPDEQHSDLKVFKNPPEKLHPYVEKYLEDSELII